ncbi:MAG: bifunctional phosphoribosylaminoimidazolecarboxamide formyltransferase/IMP cyclohydrolase [Ignavibacteria bacterium]|jgi:phosphoribosylaminoimidazolecarboxamide formyltransferase/IMP cyclohydrolase|nr:bifunctional phosphoribosylaminoimidazolecarboxamide formyltransferase/IMP cyclohydrolase [Ignavibacteria bacterium]
MNKKTALISLYYKDGLKDFAEKLIQRNFEIVSTGGTYNFLKENGIPVISVESITGFPEILDGRVKTLHPAVFAGILARKNDSNHLNQISDHHLKLFDLIAVTLYPFAETVKNPESSSDEIIEKIDIGGVSLIRAAAKNFKFIDVLVNAGQFEDYIREYDKSGGNITSGYSLDLANKAFSEIEEYDSEIKRYFASITGNTQKLRYGENPHQKAVFHKTDFNEIFEILHGKELSYNNLLDVDAAHLLINEFKYDGPTAAIIKHGNPCGVATCGTLLDAYKKAYESDTVSPFGGIIIFNKKLDAETALEVDRIFSEIILAPGYDESALSLLMKKKNRRLLNFRFSESESEYRKITGGVLYQERDNIIFNRDEVKVVTEMKPDDKQMEDMFFAYKIVKHVKSNSIVFVKNLQTLGIGGGQPSRVDSTRIAVWKAGQFNMPLKDSVVASDAFFPFADGLLETVKAGAKCVVQPGGSVRDEEVIKAANENGICMVFTGYRHFRH